MQQFIDLYNQLLGYIPDFLHPVVAFALIIIIIYAAFQIVKKNFVYLIVLIILLPASVPFLKEILNTLIEVVKYLFKTS